MRPSREHFTWEAIVRAHPRWALNCKWYSEKAWRERERERKRARERERIEARMRKQVKRQWRASLTVKKSNPSRNAFLSSPKCLICKQDRAQSCGVRERERGEREEREEKREEPPESNDRLIAITLVRQQWLPIAHSCWKLVDWGK